jgi:hypothetical protein
MVDLFVSSQYLGVRAGLAPAQAGNRKGLPLLFEKIHLFDFDPGGLRVKAAIAHFKAYLQRRYPDRSTGKHYISDLTIFSQFVGKTTSRCGGPEILLGCRLLRG